MFTDISIRCFEVLEKKWLPEYLSPVLNSSFALHEILQKNEYQKAKEKQKRNAKKVNRRKIMAEIMLTN